MSTKLPARMIAALAMTVVLLACGIAITGLASRPGDADAALVFGNTVERSGLPSRRLAARLDAALDLFNAKRVRFILVSGATGKEGFDEALAMRRYLLDRGVPDSTLIVDNRGINTRATCINARQLLHARGASSVNVVTQYFHIPRACLAAQRAGLRVAGAVAPRFFEPRDFYSLGREVVALPAYAFECRPMRSFVPAAASMSQSTTSRIPPPTVSSRIAKAELILVGRYPPPGALDERLIVDQVLIDARRSACRSASPPQSIRQSIRPEQLWSPHELRGTKQSWILLWERSRLDNLGAASWPILAPACVEDCDRMLDELADSLAESRNPNFGAVGRFLLAERERLPMRRSHEFRKVRILP